MGVRAGVSATYHRQHSRVHLLGGAADFEHLLSAHREDRGDRYHVATLEFRSQVLHRDPDANHFRIKCHSPIEGVFAFQAKNMTLKVPSDAIQKVRDRTFITLEVKVGLDNGREAEILSPVPEGTIVLIPEEELPERPSRRRRE